MIYVAEVVWADEFNDYKENTTYSFLWADSYINAMERLVAYYGDEEMVKVSLAPFSPDNLLEFDKDVLEEYELFTEVRNVLGEKIMW